jgi:predicted HNH restriction endonuclease
MWIGRTSSRFTILVKNYRFAAAMEEIKKCIPLCSNCHRILHWEERETYKREKKRKKALKGAKKA